jgi:hypothetical protein
MAAQLIASTFTSLTGVATHTVTTIEPKIAYPFRSLIVEPRAFRAHGTTADRGQTGAIALDRLEHLQTAFTVLALGAREAVQSFR